MDNEDAKSPAMETNLGPYAQLTDEQKKLIGGTRLAFFICASGHYPSAEAALEDMVRTHNEVSRLEDIDRLFDTQPGAFQRKPIDITTSKTVRVSRPLHLRR